MPDFLQKGTVPPRMLRSLMFLPGLCIKDVMECGDPHDVSGIHMRHARCYECFFDFFIRRYLLACQSAVNFVTFQRSQVYLECFGSRFNSGGVPIHGNCGKILLYPICKCDERLHVVWIELYRDLGRRRSIQTCTSGKTTLDARPSEVLPELPTTRTVLYRGVRELRRAIPSRRNTRGRGRSLFASRPTRQGEATSDVRRGSTHAAHVSDRTVETPFVPCLRSTSSLRYLFFEISIEISRWRLGTSKMSITTWSFEYPRMPLSRLSRGVRRVQWRSGSARLPPVTAEDRVIHLSSSTRTGGTVASRHGGVSRRSRVRPPPGSHVVQVSSHAAAVWMVPWCLMHLFFCFWQCMATKGDPQRVGWRKRGTRWMVGQMHVQRIYCSGWDTNGFIPFWRWWAEVVWGTTGSKPTCIFDTP